MSGPSWLASAYSNGFHLFHSLFSVSYLVGHRGEAERSRQGLGGQMESGGEPGMNLSDLQGPQLPLVATAALRGQTSRPGKRFQGPAKEQGGADWEPSLPCTLQVFPSAPCFSLLQV